MIGKGHGLREFGGVIEVFKAYCTRVGAGPFPTDLTGAIGREIRQLANEVGMTTGRDECIGWFDGVAGRYSARVNGFDSVIITRLEILDNFDCINVCAAYKLDDDRINLFPIDAELLERSKQIYETPNNWSGTIAGVTDPDDLPAKARAYMEFLETLLGVPASIISTGPLRDETIKYRLCSAMLKASTITS